jgi:hypothetical protein
MLTCAFEAMSKFFLRSVFFLFFCFFIQNISHATHLIGGEILLEWTGNENWYKVVLNKYSNMNAGGFETRLAETVYFYEKGTHIYQGKQTLPRIDNSVVNTNANYCSSPTLLRTAMQVYMGEIDLGPLRPGTYYVTWSDVYRNESIVNIERPASTEMALYTEFVWGTQNSTPKFVPLANEFFCRNELNFFDMAAIDPDNDSLVYSMVAPRYSIYPSRDVVWTFGNSYTNPIPGSVPFTINRKTGMATFNPSDYGIYVFGIKVEEYRNNVKVGEVRRDFQLNVIDCPLNNKPVVAFRDNAIREKDTLTVQLKGSTCFPIYVTDLDATQFFISETIYINAQPTRPANSLNLPYPTAGFTLPSQVPLTGFRDTARFDVCFDPCAGGNVLSIPDCCE